MARGGLNVLITNPRDTSAFIKEMSKFQFHIFAGVNTLFSSLLNAPEFKNIDFSEMRSCIGGGMAVQPAVAAEWKKATGKTILQGYGLTETSPVAIVNRFDS